MARIDGFRLSPSDIRLVGHDLARPECVLTLPDGTLWLSDNRSAVMRIDPDGAQTRIGQIEGAPNGIAMDRDGRLLVAEIEHGKLWRVARDGRRELLLDRLDDAPLGSVNFVLVDALDRAWITVSTRTVPRRRAIDEDIADGYVLRLDPGQAAPRLVADGFRFTNEVRIDAAQRYLYVAETAVGAVTRLPLRPDGSVGAAEPFGPRPLFEGAKVDGIAFDADGNLWVTELSRNALIALRPDGTPHEVFADPQGRVLDTPTSIAFGGPDLRTVFVGSLRMDRLASFRSAVPGEPLAHWRAL